MARKECLETLHKGLASGALEGDLSTAVRHILKVLSGDIMAARSMNRLREDPRVHFEVHSLLGGLEIRSVFRGPESDSGVCTLSLFLFRTAGGTFQLRFHER